VGADINSVSTFGAGLNKIGKKDSGKVCWEWQKEKFIFGI